MSKKWVGTVGVLAGALILGAGGGMLGGSLFDNSSVASLPGDSGQPGAQGLRGANGADGADGAHGVAGLNGHQGSIGPVGPSGSVGPEGRIGPRGAVGPDGPMGPMGAAGSDGTAGSNGSQGLPGINGQDGLPGAPGMDGAPGFTEFQSLTIDNFSHPLIDPADFFLGVKIGELPELSAGTWWLSVSMRNSTTALCWFDDVTWAGSSGALFDGRTHIVSNPTGTVTVSEPRVFAEPTDLSVRCMFTTDPSDTTLSIKKVTIVAIRLGD